MPFTFQNLIDVLLLEDYNVRLVVISTVLLGITSGLIGSFLLMRKRSLMGDALSHATLPGIGIAFAVMILLGGSGKYLPGLLLGASVSGIIGVLTMLTIIRTTRLREDVAMGFVLSVFFGFGVAVLQLVKDIPGASAAGLESFIYGKAASIVFQDSLLIGAVSAITALTTILLRKELTLLCFDDNYAAAQGWPVLWLDILMLGLVTAVTVIGLQAVGLILVIAFLIIPAAAARFWTHRLGVMLTLAAVIGGVSGWLGASLSALLPKLPAGAVIVLVAASIFLVSMVFGTARGVLPKFLDHARLKRRIGRQHLLRAAYEILEHHNRPAINLPISKESMLEHRAWTPRNFKRLLSLAKREDHLEPSAPGTLRLSESGFGEAARITRNHRLWELYLIRHADIAPSHVDRDADMVEHILGAEIVRQLESELGPETGIPDSPPPHSNRMNWTSFDTWIAVTAMLCAVSCALPGCFLVLRKMSMMGDAISHAVLPGLAIAFLMTGSRASLPMFFGAAVVGVLTALFTQWISRFGQVDRGAAMGIVFTTLFALGLVLIVRAADHVDLDPGCVLYGALELTPLDVVKLGGLELPRAAAVNGLTLLFNLGIIALLYKEFRLSSFDPQLSDTLGFSSGFLHYLLMTMVAVTTVAAFESVGSIIVIAMLIVPPAAALLLTRRLLPMLIISVLLAAISAWLGRLLAMTLPRLVGFEETATSGMIAFAAGSLFTLAWLFAPDGGLISRHWRKTKPTEA